MLDNIDYGEYYEYGDDLEDEKEDIPIDEMILQEEKQLYKKQLKKLELVEKQGINGSVMLYSDQPKEKVWHSDEYMVMVDRLTKTKNGDIDEYKFVRAKIWVYFLDEG